MDNTVTDVKLKVDARWYHVLAYSPGMFPQKEPDGKVMRTSSVEAGWLIGKEVPGTNNIWEPVRWIEAEEIAQAVCMEAVLVHRR